MTMDQATSNNPKEKRAKHKALYNDLKAVAKSIHKEESVAVINSQGNEYNHKIRSAIGILKKGKPLTMYLCAFRQAEMILTMIEQIEPKLSKRLQLREAGNLIELYVPIE